MLRSHLEARSARDGRFLVFELAQCCVTPRPNTGTKSQKVPSKASIGFPKVTRLSLQGRPVMRSFAQVELDYHDTW